MHEFGPAWRSRRDSHLVRFSLLTATETFCCELAPIIKVPLENLYGGLCELLQFWDILGILESDFLLNSGLGKELQLCLRTADNKAGVPGRSWLEMVWCLRRCLRRESSTEEVVLLACWSALVRCFDRGFQVFVLLLVLLLSETYLVLAHMLTPHNFMGDVFDESTWFSSSREAFQSDDAEDGLTFL